MSGPCHVTEVELSVSKCIVSQGPYQCPNLCSQYWFTIWEADWEAP